MLRLSHEERRTGNLERREDHDTERLEPQRRLAWPAYRDPSHRDTPRDGVRPGAADSHDVVMPPPAS
jgi:hypothetical protein